MIEIQVLANINYVFVEWNAEYFLSKVTLEYM